MRLPWVGAAAVTVSIVHVLKGKWQEQCHLDGRKTEIITAYLFHAGTSNEPFQLLANSSLSFKGQEPYGKGFQFADDIPEASSISQMNRLIESNPENAKIIKPYLGGDEILTDPLHRHSRYVIDFGTLSEHEAGKWPDLLRICAEKVRSERSTKAKEVARWSYWQFWRVRGELRDAIVDKERVMAHPFTSSYLAFVFIPAETILASPHVVIANGMDSGFGTLQSRIHEIWVKFFGSSLEDRLRYTPSDCFETFPFPANWETDPTLEAIGKTYYEYRADLMVRNNQGLTDTYNRFHDPDERDPAILHLRQLHDQMDRAVLNAYGWTDIDTPCGFTLDYLDTDSDDLPPAAQDRIASGDLFFPTADEASTFGALISTGKRKLPWRYKWPEATHDEVLARLLDLNQQRHEAEVLGGKHAHGKAGKKAKGKRQKLQSDQNNPTIPGMEV